MKKPKPTFLGAMAAIVCCGAIAALVLYAPLVAAVVFVLLLGVIFLLSIKTKSFWKASWEVLKRLLTGW